MVLWGVQTVAAQSVLAGTNWVLSSLDGQLPLAGTTVTLQFDEEAASGTDGCNQYSVGYTVEGSSLSFGAVGATVPTDTGPAGVTTMMACPEAVMTQATAYMEALAATTAFVVRGGNLVLLDGSTILATFVSSVQDLDSTTWEVVSFNNGRGAVTTLLEGSAISAAFDDENRVSGNSGCNDYFATWLASDGAIHIGAIGSTRRLCDEPAGIMEQEAEYQAALQSARTYTIVGNNMEMRDASDAIAVHMRRVLIIDPPEPEPGVPTGRVTAPNGVNVRTGPGTNFPSLGVAPFGTEGEIIGRSADGQWWVVAAPQAPGGMAWVSADFVAVTDADDVPIIASPPPPIVIVPTPAPTPWPTPTRVPAPTATPTAQMSFSASRTTINQGECTTLQWSVENVQAVWVYPQGQPYQNFPRVGQGTEEVCPPTTTTYEMRVLLRDGSVSTQRVTINVVPAAPQNPLNGTAWQATGFNNGNNAVVSPISGTTLTARFDASQISGNGGCNNFSGSYSVSGSNIWIGSLGGTQMACSDVSGQMEQESQYLAALQSAATFQFDGSQLTLRRWDGSIAAIFNRLQ
jgi:heat shock protein HslJ